MTPYIFSVCSAFCNPADVEAFTEEKKQSLVKRQGKGADFVRAVKEIVDSYEKLKKERQLGEANCGNVADANISNSVINSGASDNSVSCEVTATLPIKSSNSVVDRHDLVCPAEDDSADVLKDESNDKEVSKMELSDNAPSVQSPKPLTYSSRKRSAGDLCPQGFITDRHMPVRRNRSTSRAQNFLFPCNDSGKNAGSQLTNATQGASVRRNQRLRKSPDLAGRNDLDSSASVLNGSLEDKDNSSEILTNDSDEFSLNEGSAMDSNYKHTETIECPEEVELNKGLDLKIKGVVNKKKRNPNRKRATNDSSKSTIKLEEDLGVRNSSQSSQNICGNSEEKCFEQDGDEHLPLVKRARVRMGKSSSTEGELNSIPHAPGKSCKEDINSPPQMITSSNCENGSSADGGSSVLIGTVDNVSPSKTVAPCFENQTGNTKRDQPFCSVDDEAALPPSKRLHRALEAMSANAAEEGQARIEPSSSRMTSIGISAIKTSPDITINNHEGGGLELQKSDACNGNSSHTIVHSLSANSNPMISTENDSSKQVDKLSTRFQAQETGKVVLPCTADHVEELGDFVVCHTTNADLKIQAHKEISPNLDSKCCEVESNQDSPHLSLPPNNEHNIITMNHSNTSSDASEDNGISLHSETDVAKKEIISPRNNIDLPRNEVVISDDTKCLKPAIDDVNRANEMGEVVKEVEREVPEEDLNSVSTSDCPGEKVISGIRSSTSLTDGGDCIPQGSPPNTSICNVSTSDSSNILHNGSCSPDVHLHQKQSLSGPVDESKYGSEATQQSRSMGKSTEAARAALLYFEAMLGTLKRTKESIGRATRIAIDCAKFGIADKGERFMHFTPGMAGNVMHVLISTCWVMEILAHNLETESSLHRRVDLFFLVDSIAQFSRGLKGDVCLVYSSSIQAVLPRLLSAAVPPGNAAQENRRQCLKVLRLWLERRILPEPMIRHHIRELDLYSSISAGVFSRRSLRTERALDDPIREMEGMHVDEYGSNSSLQLPGFCMPRMLKDEDDNEGSDSDEGNFEAVTPEHISEAHEMTSTIDKHRHILEDVDGELEMEDVAPSRDVEMNSFCNVDRGNTTALEKNLSLSSAPLPQLAPQCSAPPASAPPPPPPPPPPP
ncbi:HUA2-like protein 3-like, partial [Trifolium pratense]